MINDFAMGGSAILIIVWRRGRKTNDRGQMAMKSFELNPSTLRLLSGLKAICAQNATAPNYGGGTVIGDFRLTIAD